MDVRVPIRVVVVDVVGCGVGLRVRGAGVVAGGQDNEVDSSAIVMSC